MLSALRILAPANASRHTAVAGAYKHWTDALRRCGSSLAPAAPGTVQAYDQHLFIQAGSMSPADWPKTVEKTPAILGAFAALAKRKEDITGMCQCPRKLPIRQLPPILLALKSVHSNSRGSIADNGWMACRDCEGHRVCVAGQGQ